MDIKLENFLVEQTDFSLSADLTIKHGTTAIIGPSGGGKSTLLLAIAGFVDPARGGISIGGNIVTSTPPAKRPVTLLFQEHNLFSHLTVFKNTGLGVRPDLKLSKTQIEQVEDALEKVGLVDMGTRRPSELSGGQRQRVALARALLRDRPVLMLDEPFAALGPALRHEMLDLVARIRQEQNSTLLMVTHNPDDALRIAEHTVLVADGVAQPPQPTVTLLNNPPPALAAYLGK
ncbi:thiamine ABC transporter, ATP-binding protein [Rhodobacterales bacterium 52_120_T64]|nr:thiamine ABC transporter, ATP-binding protein [Rhodobacterales bacterium 52_120_T64]